MLVRVDMVERQAGRGEGGELRLDLRRELRARGGAGEKRDADGKRPCRRGSFRARRPARGFVRAGSAGGPRRARGGARRRARHRPRPRNRIGERAARRPSGWRGQDARTMRPLDGLVDRGRDAEIIGGDDEPLHPSSPSRGGGPAAGWWRGGLSERCRRCAERRPQDRSEPPVQGFAGRTRPLPPAMHPAASSRAGRSPRSCASPSTSIAIRRAAQKKSSTKGPAGCWRRNFRPAGRVRSACQSFTSGSVISARRTRAFFWVGLGPWSTVSPLHHQLRWRSPSPCGGG